MNVMVRQAWTQEAFLDWVGHQEEPFEFDGIGPVPMNGGTFTHSLIVQNITFALRSKLHSQGYVVLGAGAAIETIGGAIRYPDALVSTVKPVGSALKIDGVVAVFEVVSPSSERTDRMLKLREYAAVPSLRCYVIVEQAFVGLTVFSRDDPARAWSAMTITDPGEAVDLPELGTAITLSEIYEGVDLKDGEEAATAC